LLNAEASILGSVAKATKQKDAWQTKKHHVMHFWPKRQQLQSLNAKQLAIEIFYKKSLRSEGLSLTWDHE
jgi:hypothetical protein